MTASRFASSVLLELASASRSLPVPFPLRGLSFSSKGSTSNGTSSAGYSPYRWLQTARQQYAGTEAPFPERVRGLLQSYKQLSKAKLSMLVVLTAGAGYALGSGQAIDYEGLGWTSLGTFACAACANSLNQVYERVNDSLMQRTRNRPLPAGRLGVGHALCFAAATGVLGVGILFTQTNTTTAVLGASNILLYAGLYTPMKQMTIWNTWLGAVVGAVPPLMGWAAASGGLNASSAVLASTLYFWQLPHFLALAWMCKDDYIRGGFRMISMLDPTGRRTAASAVRNCLYLLPVGVAAAALGLTTAHFTIENTVLSLGLAFYAAQFWRDPSKNSARRLFRISLLYLPVSMACAIAHRVPQNSSQTVAATQPEIHEGITADLAALDYVIDAMRNGILNVHTGALALFAWYESFLPGSNDLKCPSKAYGDSIEDEEEAAPGESKDSDQPDHS